MAMGPIILLPGANDYPSSNPATPDVVNGRTVLDFDATTDESVDWTFIMPQQYASGTLTAHVHYAMSSATSGNVVLQASVEAVADGESVSTDSFDSANGSGQVAVPGTAGLKDIASITLTNKDSVAAGELVRLRLRRDADSTSATDDAAGDMELLAVEIREA